MSVEQLALETKIPRPSIEALEEDRFSALPGPVFVRGFFRCCARALGLDPETVAGLLHEHLRAQKAAAQRGTRRPAAIQAVNSIRSAARPSRPEPARVRTDPEAVAVRPAALAAAPAAPVAEAPHAALDAVLQAGARSLEFLRNFSQLPQSRTLMWIAVCLVIAVIAVTAFALSGGQVALPHS